MALCLALVTEEDFPKLKSLVAEKNFPGDYTSYLKHLEDQERDAIALQLTVARVKICPQEFEKWLTGRPATSSDLLRYARRVFYKATSE